MKNESDMDTVPLYRGPSPSLARRRGFADGWRWEILAMTVSIAFVTAVVVILLKIEDKPLSCWTLFLSPSATLAIAITAAKSTAAFTVASAISQCKWLHFRSGARRLRDLDLFDEAARGPLGAVRLLCSGAPWKIASIGALVTILALAVDTFVQQVVKLNPRDVGIDDGNATFALAHTYFSTAVASGFFRESRIPIEASSIDRPMPGAIYGGLFNTNAPRVFTCSSSKCAWNETYVSLGFASSCADVTAATFKNRNASAFGDAPWKLAGSFLVTPGGVNLSAQYMPGRWQTVVSVGGMFLLESIKDRSTGLPVINSTMSPKLARIAILRSASDIFNNVILLNQTEVTECTISLAAYRYSGISASGNNLAVTTEIAPLSDGLITSNYSSPEKQDTQDFVVSFQQEGSPTLQATLYDLVALGYFFNTTRFSGNIYNGEEAPAPPTGIGNAFLAGNISEMIQNMTLSMTNHLRSGFNVTERGLSITPVVFITVEWKWLAVPILVEIAALAFLLLTIIESRPRRDGSQQVLWKASTVAVLCYHLWATDKEGGRPNGVLRTDVQNMDDLKKLAWNTRARIG